MGNKSQKHNLRYTEILENLRHYCAYRERCLQEVGAKLKDLQVKDRTSERIINELIKENFINEKRYAEVFTRGKFRINKWGKLKITAELKMRNIPEKYILAGLLEIDDDEYQKTLRSLIEKKSESVFPSTL